MKKNLMFLIVLMVMVLATGGWGAAFAADAVAPAADPALSGWSSFTDSAKKVGKEIKLDGFIVAGKLFDVQKEEVGELDKIHLTSQKGSFFIQAEIGARYGIVRPFIGYEALTHTYDKKSFGADLFLYSTEKFGSYGIRTSYTVTRRLGIDSQKYIFSGLIVKF